VVGEAERFPSPQGEGVRRTDEGVAKTPSVGFPLSRETIGVGGEMKHLSELGFMGF